MRIEKLELNKVKVTLFSDDLRMFNIDVKKIMPDSPEVYEFLGEIMKKVRIETNFNPYDGQVVVEATPVDDGLILMVSKTEKVHRKIDPKKIKSIRAVKKMPKESIYEVQDFDEACKLIENCMDFIDGTTVLYNMNDKFYFVFAKENLRIREFAKKLDSGYIFANVLKEHGKAVAKGEELLRIAEFLKSE